MSEREFPSTTWEWKRVKMRRPAGGQTGRAAPLRRWYLLPPWPPRKPLSLSVKFRGGQECWYEIHARGSSGRVPGTIALHDLMSEIMRLD